MLRRILIVVACVSAICLTAAAHAQTSSLGVSSLTVQAQVNSDGTASITQTITYPRAEQLSWTLYNDVSRLSVQADGTATAIRRSSLGQATRISSSVSAKTWLISYQSANLIIRHDDRDQFYVKLFENPTAAIANIAVIFTLPGNLAETDLNGNLYAIGGVSAPNTQKVANNQLLFTSSFASTSAVFTVSANWPKGLVAYNWWTNLKLSLLNLNLLPWLVVGILLPFICLLVLLDLIYKRRQSNVVTTGVRSSIPSDLSPVLVGVLVNTKIQVPTIIALIIDLCQRGYLVIIKKNNTFSLGKQKEIDDHLQSWERNIIEQLFQQGGLEVSLDQHKKTNSQALFSPKVTTAFNAIYGVITALNYFTENPHYTRVRYKLIGISMYFISTIGLIWLTVTNTSTVALIPFAAMIIIAFLILKFSPQLVQYTTLGARTRADWLAFGNYLREDKGFGWKAYERHTFERYLPYAIVLGATKEWAKRFDDSNLAIAKPDWFISYGDISIGELTDEIVNFTSAIATTLQRLKGPLVN